MSDFDPPAHRQRLRERYSHTHTNAMDAQGCGLCVLCVLLDYIETLEAQVREQRGEIAELNESELAWERAAGETDTLAEREIASLRAERDALATQLAAQTARADEGWGRASQLAAAEERLAAAEERVRALREALDDICTSVEAYCHAAVHRALTATAPGEGRKKVHEKPRG